MGLAAAILLASGGVGLHYVDVISETLRRSSEITGPLLSDVLEITQAGRRARATVRTVAEQCADVDRVDAEMKAFEATTTKITRDLTDLADQAGATKDLAGIAASENRFRRIGEKVLEACRSDALAADRLAATATVIESRLAAVSAILDDLDGAAVSFLRDGDGRAAGRTAQARVAPDFTALARLRNDFASFTALVDTLAALGTTAAVDDFAAHQRERLATLAADVRDVEPVMAALGLAEAQRRLTAEVKGLADALVGGDGMTGARRTRIEARDSLAAQRLAIGTIDDEYFHSVRALEATARRLDETARDQVVDSTHEAYVAVAATSVALLFLVLGIAGDMGRRLATPLGRITRHVARLRGLEDIDSPLDPSLLRRDDEFGLLARSFTRLTTELTEARRDLEEETRTQVLRQYDRLQATIATMPQGFFLMDADECLVVWNDSFLHMFGFRPGEVVVGMPVARFLERCAASGASAHDRSEPTFTRAKAEGRSCQDVVDYIDGRVMVITASPTSDGGVAVTHEDITMRRRVEEEIDHLSRFDADTGLPNRAWFRTQIADALSERLADRHVALIHVDLDHFKSINDSLGHAVGDRVLVAVAERIVECAGENSLVGRLGGDEFAVLRPGLVRPEAAADLARRIDEGIRRPFDVDGMRVLVGANIGIAVAPSDAANADDLLAHADLALGLAKSEGRGVPRFWEPGMDAGMQMRRALESDLACALERGEFEMHYQPLVGARSGRIEGFEALLRWRHPERGLVSPVDFVPLVEETGQVGEIGAWALREATRVAASWPRGLRVAVNISPIQFKRRALALDVLGALGASGLGADRLELEITEGILLVDTEATLATLTQLREIGVRIAMDDFGTGYSSLGYLRRFAFDKVKIDQSFVRDLGETADSVAIVRAVTSLCSSLGITTVAEGVETEEQRDRLALEGCDQFQGWLFGRPVTEHEVPDLLAANDQTLCEDDDVEFVPRRAGSL